MTLVFFPATNSLSAITAHFSNESAQSKKSMKTANLEQGWPSQDKAFALSHLTPDPGTLSWPVDKSNLTLTGADILKDPAKRISNEFKISSNLEPRVRFWLDIYTRHDDTTHVIHHTRYPWIVYEIIETKFDIENGKGPKWLRVERANKKVQARRNLFRRTLKKLSRNPFPKKPTSIEASLISALKPIKGKRRHVYAQAALSLRSQLGQKNFFEQAISRSTQHLPYMEEIFGQMGLPKELTRMPFVESSFNEKAVSKVGASGIWQIMPSTGDAYGIVGNQIDERNSPIKATQMAARILKSYRRALGSWPLAVTAYNNGIGNIRVAMKKARSKNLEDIIERYHDGDFKFASSNFYSCFLAALYANHYQELFFPEVDRQPLLVHDRIQLKKSMPLGRLLKVTGLNFSELRRYNQDLKPMKNLKLKIPRGFDLYLPVDVAQNLAIQLGGAVRSKPVVQPKLSSIEAHDTNKPVVDNRDAG